MVAKAQHVAVLLLVASSMADAGETDPKHVLNNSAKAIAQLSSASYHMETHGTGLLANRVISCSCEVACVRQPTGGVAIKFEGEFLNPRKRGGAATQGDAAFSAYFRAGSGVFCPKGSEAVSCAIKQTDRGFMTFKEISCIVLLEAGTFEKEISRRPKLMGKKEIDGISCFMIQTSRRDFESQVWYIAENDWLPRRIDFIGRSREGGETVCQISRLKLNPPLGDDQFEPPPPPPSPHLIVADAAGDECDERMKKARMEIQQVKPPAWMKIPDWSDVTTLDLAVSIWMREAARAERVTTYDSVDWHMHLSKTAQQAKERLWTAPRKQTGMGHDPGVLRPFEGKLNALHYLSALGMDKALLELIDSSTSEGLIQQDALGRSPLDYAAIYGRTSAVQALCDRSISLQNRTLRPLCLASAMGHVEVVKVLLAMKAPVSAEDENGKTPLEYALEGGNDATIDVLFAALAPGSGSDPKSTRRLKEFMRPALSAISNKRVDVLRKLAKRVDLTGAVESADIGLSIVVDTSGRTDHLNLLHYAAGHGNKAVMEFLMNEMHLEAASFDEIGRPPLFFASSAEIAAVLLAADPTLIEHKAEKDRTVAHFLAGRNSDEALQFVLRKRPSLLNEKDKENRTPIEFAVLSQSPATLKVLIEAGADPMKKMNDSDSALGGIVDSIVITALGEHVGGWFVSEESTLLHVSARLGCRSTAEVLLSRGVSVNARDNCDRSPLVVALVHKQYDFAKWLIQGRIDAVKANNGKEPGINTGSLAVLNVNLSSDNGCRAIHFAAAAGNQELVKLLMDAGAEVSVAAVPNVAFLSKFQDAGRGCGLGFESGATPYDLARAGGYYKVADLIKKRAAENGESKKE